MYKIKTINAISPIGLNQFPQELYEVSSEINLPDAILVRSQALHDYTIPTSLKVVGRAGAGLNNIPVDKLTKHGIPVFNTPGANANAVRELVIAGMLLASRNICNAWNYVCKLTMEHNILQNEIEKNKKNYSGFEIMGKTLGVVGLGCIGVKVANAALNLGMKVIGYDPAITVAHAWELSSNVKKASCLEDLLKQADFVSLHVPLNNETRNMINQNTLSIMKSAAIILNFSREGIVDEAALVGALQSKQVHTFVTDFPTPKLLLHPQVIALPHLGASTKEAEENCAIMIAKQVRAFLEEGSITNAVNFPNLEIPKNDFGVRLAIVNANVPNMVAQISAQLALAKLNIIALVNKSKNDIAYTVIDLQSKVNGEVIKQIKNIDGVMQLRVINPLH